MRPLLENRSWLLLPFLCLVFSCFLFLVTYHSVEGQGKDNVKPNNFISLSFNQYFFRNSTNKPYIEVFTNIELASLKPKLINNSNYQTRVKLAVFITPFIKGIESKSNVTSVELLSPITQDTLGLRKMTQSHNFRIELNDFNDADSIEIMVSAVDLNIENSSTTTIVKKLLNDKKNLSSFSFSDIVFVNSFSKTQNDTLSFQKYGYSIVPITTNSYLENKDTLKAYFEYYKLNEITKEPYFVYAFIKETNSDDESKHVFINSKAKMPKDLDVSYIYLPLKGLPSNTYVLVIELKDQSGKVLSRKEEYFFLYSISEKNNFTENPRNVNIYDKLYAFDEKQLKEILPKLRYISSEVEINFLSTLKTFESKKNYFVNFWKKRELDIKNPTKQWQNYLNRVRYSNQKFNSTFRDGWLTDRGRVMITYGPPADVQSFPVEHDKLPYEIWTYNTIKSQSGVIFVFIDSDLATNSYPLIHSSLIGEVYNANWRSNLLKKREKDFEFNSPGNQNYDNFKETVPGTTGSPR